MNIDEQLSTILNPPRRFEPVLPVAVIRQQCDDFEVEEIPAYLPDGCGEHLYLWIEKRDLPAAQFLSCLARSLKASPRDIGVAGQKDRRAVTRQFVSVPRSCESQLDNIADDRIRLLSVSAHGNKLRTGHLQGNRFRVVLRAADKRCFTTEHFVATTKRLKLLEQRGFPNYFGPQRFGHGGRTATEGINFLKGAISPKYWKHNQRRFMTKMVASAAQSAVMNLNLAGRVLAETCDTPLAGDVVCRRGGIRPFLFDDRGDTAATDVIPMGPMPGPKMINATRDVAESEETVLKQLGLVNDDFTRYRKLTSGTRRRYVEYPSHCSAELLDDGAICVSFELPAGTFATVLLSELTRL